MRTIWIWWSRGDTSEDEEDGIGRELRDCVGVYGKLKNEREGLVVIEVAEV